MELYAYVLSQFIVCFYLFGREKSSIYGSVSKSGPVGPEPDQNQSQTQPEFPLWLTEVQNFSHHLLPPRVCISRKWNQKWRQGAGTVGRAGQPTICSASILCGHQFGTWLLYFQSSSLLICLGKRYRMAQALNPYTHMQDPEEAPGPPFLMAQPGCCSLFLCNSFLANK